MIDRELGCDQIDCLGLLIGVGIVLADDGIAGIVFLPEIQQIPVHLVFVLPEIDRLFLGGQNGCRQRKHEKNAQNKQHDTFCFCSKHANPSCNIK